MARKPSKSVGKGVRRINGRKFVHWEHTTSKQKAKEMAWALRQQGKNARIIKRGNHWFIYVSVYESKRR